MVRILTGYPLSISQGHGVLLTVVIALNLFRLPTEILYSVKFSFCKVVIAALFEESVDWKQPTAH